MVFSERKESLPELQLPDPASLAQENSLSLRKIRKDRLRSRGRSGRIMKNTTLIAGKINNQNLTIISTVGGITGRNGDVANDSKELDTQPKPESTDLMKKVVFNLPTISSSVSTTNISIVDNVNNSNPQPLVQDTLQNITEDSLLQEEEEEEDRDGDIDHHHDDDSEDEDDGNSEQGEEEQEVMQRQQEREGTNDIGHQFSTLLSVETKEGSTESSRQVDQIDNSTHIPSNDNNNNNNNKYRNIIKSKENASVTIERTNPLFGLWEGSFILKNKLSAPEQDIPETFFFHSLYTPPSISSHTKSNSLSLPLELRDLPVDPQFYGTVLGFLPSTTSNFTNAAVHTSNTTATDGSSAATSSQASGSMDGSSSHSGHQTPVSATASATASTGSGSGCKGQTTETEQSVSAPTATVEPTSSIPHTTTTTSAFTTAITSSVVTGFGRNCFGRFALLGVYDANTASKRGRKPSGGALLSHLIMPTGSGSTGSGSAPLSTRSSHAVPVTTTTTTDVSCPSLVTGISTTVTPSSGAAIHSSGTTSTSTGKRSAWEGSGQRREEELDDSGIPAKRLRKSSISKSSKSYSYSFDGNSAIDETAGSTAPMGSRRSRGDGGNEESVSFRGATVDPATGEIYEGSWEDGQRNGSGVCLYPEGLMYQGSWSKGKESGVGQLMHGDRQLIYSGDWFDGRMHGHGTYFFPNGDEYTGEWKEGMRHGTGSYKLSDGSRYNGDWKENKRNGKGIFVWSDGSTYEGDWDDNMRHGRGELKLVSGFRYEGNWIKNCMEGRGTSVFPDGQEYQGMFRWGKRDGRGSVKFAEGAVYEGRFKDDRIDGQGTLQITRTVPGAEDGEKLIPILIRADMRRIHYRAGFGDDLLR